MNVIVYVMDALRPDFLSCYGHGYETSPMLDSFAEDAVRFETAYATATWTKPSAVSLLTGRHPSASGVMHRLDRVPSDPAMLPHRLGEAGFDTHAVSANYFVSESFGFDGFDRFSLLQDESKYRRVRQRAKEPLETTREIMDDLDIDELVTPLSADINDVLFDVFEDGTDEQFILAWSIDTHDPFFVRGEESVFGNSTDDIIFEAETDSENLDRVRSLYRDMIRYNDRQFGRLLQHLHRTGCYEDSLIIVLSDHGESFGEHTKYLGRPILGHNDLVFEEVIRVPLLVKFPGGDRAAESVSSPVQLVDIYPTVMDVLDLELPDHLDGRSLEQRSAAFDPQRGIFVESQPTPRHAYSAAYREGSYKAMTLDKPWPGPGNWRGILGTVLWKLGMPGEQLFDLDLDPGEGLDLRYEHPEVHAKLMATLRSERDRLADLAPTDRADRVPPDDETARQLAALGYRD